MKAHGLSFTAFRVNRSLTFRLNSSFIFRVKSLCYLRRCVGLNANKGTQAEAYATGLREIMRIKIIGDNNCARATRHLLRTAGFAVTEYLPAEVITQAPHSGYAITIEVAKIPSSGNTPDSSGEFFEPQESGNTLGESPTFMPEHSTLGQPANAHGEASAFVKELADASSPAFAGPSEDIAGNGGGGECGEAQRGNQGTRGDELTGGSQSACDVAGHIHFDSVDSELEAAVLRHVTQLAAWPVVVDRSGGQVRSERELRLVVPLAKNSLGKLCMDEGAAIAVEFGILRGMLDLTSADAANARAGKSRTSADSVGRRWSSWTDSRSEPGGNETDDKSGVSGSSQGGRRKKKWWGFGLFLVLVGVLSLTVTTEAAPRTAPAAAAAGLTRGSAQRLARTSANIAAGAAGCGFGRSVEERGVEGAYLHIAAAPAPAAVLAPAFAVVAAMAPAADPAQGQFATGQPTRITDGTNTLVVDPCKGQARLFVSINQTGNTQLVAGTASKKIYICSIHVVVAAATSVAVVEGTGSVCAKGTAGVSGFGGATAATGWNFGANGGIAFGNGEAAVGAEGTAADNLCLYNSGSGQVSGGIGYVVQ